MSNALRQRLMIGGSLLAMTMLTAGCYGHIYQVSKTSTYTPQSSMTFNCEALKRQQIYNQTNMNTETNNTTLAQRAALNAEVLKRCRLN